MSDRLNTVLFAPVDTLHRTPKLNVLPLHVAITPVFQVERSATQQLLRRIDQQFSERRTFRFTGQEDILVDENVKARKVGGSVLYIMHDAVLPVVTRFDPKVDTSFSGDNYQPHVKYIGERGLREGQEVRVSELFIGQQEPQVDDSAWIIMDTIKLSQPNYDSGARVS